MRARRSSNPLSDPPRLRTDPNGGPRMPDRCCPEALTAYRDDALSACECIDVRRHLESCAACREALEGHRRVARLLGTWVSPSVRPGFQERVCRRLDERVV